MRRVCVFCGAGPYASLTHRSSAPSGAAQSHRFLSAAQELGRAIALRGLGLVYGGAAVGMMRALADSALGAGGEVIGVIPRVLADREIAHSGVSELVVVETMHARKARMVELSDAFVALPGGFGTLDELFEVTTWAQLGLHDKPIGLLDLDGWFQPLASYVDQALAAGLIKAEYGALWTLAPDIPSLLDILGARR